LVEEKIIAGRQQSNGATFFSPVAETGAMTLQLKSRLTLSKGVFTLLTQFETMAGMSRHPHSVERGSNLDGVIEV